MEEWIILTLVVLRGEWPASCPSLSTHGERAPSFHLAGGWIGLGAGVIAVKKMEVSCPCQKYNSYSLAGQSIISHCSNRAILPCVNSVILKRSNTARMHQVMLMSAFIVDIRKKEHDYLQKTAYCQSLSISMAPTVPVISAIITFLAHVSAGNSLTAAQVLFLQFSASVDVKERRYLIQK